MRKKIYLAVAIMGIALSTGLKSYADDENTTNQWDTDTCVLTLPNGGTKTGTNCSVTCGFLQSCPCTRSTACH